MNDYTYAGLSAQYATYNERNAKWYRDLQLAASALVKTIERTMHLPSPAWESPDGKGRHHYVYLFDRHSEDHGRITGLLPQSAITDDGWVTFGLAITLEIAPNTYPTTVFSFTVAVQYRANQIWYALWDRESEQSAPETESQDSAAFARSLLDRLQTNLAYDPLSGPPTRDSFGFLPSSVGR